MSYAPVGCCSERYAQGFTFVEEGRCFALVTMLAVFSYAQEAFETIRSDVARGNSVNAGRILGVCFRSWAGHHCVMILSVHLGSDV